jgi:glycosyltransferase involved in cell wall biosynthesis
VKIAIDARKLHDGGIGSYIRGTLGALSAAPGGHAFVALVDPRQRGSVRWPGPVREVAVRAGKYGLGEHLWVPRAARREGVDLLHAPHYTLPLGWSGPSVVTIHDLTHIRFARFFPPGVSLYARAMAGVAARRARVVLTDSAHTRDDVLAFLRVPESKVRVVPLGVSADVRRPEPERIDAFVAARGLPANYVLYVGARKRAKNLETLLRALARLQPSRRPPLVLSGPRGAAELPWAREAVALGLENEIHFAGDLADDDALSCLYAGALLYAHPSLAEGFGLTPLEAMACGTPVIASTAGSLPEVVGDAAVQLPALDVDAWSAAIESLAGDAMRREELGRLGLARARTFTWARTAEHTLRAYEDAVA